MRRFSRTGGCGAAALGAFLLALVLASAAVVEARAAGRALLPATPLILKDGRIANVAVHVLEFAEGAEEIGPEAAAELGDLTRQVATDCFLTAQVIGHVGLAEVRANDTLGAHRLARSRADAVQSALIGGGLPANAIASVWDWQFLVREPRATIWLFRLTRGEDCEGKPLQDGDPALVAGAEPEPATTATPAAPSSDQAGRSPEARGAAAGGADRRAEPAQEDPAPRSEPAGPTAAAERGEADAADRSAGAPAGPAQVEARGPELRAEEEPAAAPAPEREIEAAAADGQTGRAEPERAAEAGTPPPEKQAKQTVAETAPPAETEDSEPERPRAGQSKGGGEASTKQRAKADDQEHRSASGQAGLAEAEPEPDQKQTAAGRPERAGPEATATQEPARSASDEPEPATVVAQDDRMPGQDSGPVRRRTRGGVPTVVQPLPALGSKPSQSSESEDDATARPAHQSHTVVAAAEAAQPKAEAESGGPMLVITFANNSSYFPPGTTTQLRSLIRELEPGQRYRVRLLGAVSASDQVVGASTPEEAERYNKWLATRRVERVESWLAENAAERELSIASEFVPENNSREVTVRIAPAG